MADYGWCWEGQGLDPGVGPTSRGLGDGARYFGLHKCCLMYDEHTPQALASVADMTDVVLDVTRWSGTRVDANGNTVSKIDRTRTLSEIANAITLKQTYPNIKGVIIDDFPRHLIQSGITLSSYRDAYRDLKAAGLELWWIAFPDTLDDQWDYVGQYVDVLVLWAWDCQPYDVDTAKSRLQAKFPSARFMAGLSLRDYSRGIASNGTTLANRAAVINNQIALGNLAGYCILGTVLIDVHPVLAAAVKNYIAAH